MPTTTATRGLEMGMQATKLESTDAAAYGKRCDKAEAFRLDAECLANAFMAAALANPLATIPTPAWIDGLGGKRRATLVDVLNDGLSGIGSDAAWSELVEALTMSPEGLAFLRKRAEVYAADHASDEVEA